MGRQWLALPREWLASFGEIVSFCATVVGEVFSLKVFRFFGEALRQAGLLILSSTLVIWGLIFIIGLQCGSRARTSTAPSARPRTRACSPPGATCASWSRTRSAT
jgi:phospholipid/cholesterol/gamma-HCH transport system permease protein